MPEGRASLVEFDSAVLFAVTNGDWTYVGKIKLEEAKAKERITGQGVPDGINARFLNK